jgi:glycosyltransferase involved in cell wall biosynthesis|tara:strand:+ start:124 stop:1152 length:1029 start_codon:yes stop_codon:yes gene_type:complete
MIKLSICIPTYNRIECLNNCLNSILIAKKNNYNFNFEVCISDNCSKENVKKIIDKYSSSLNISFSQNSNNLGLGVNILKAVSLAKGEYVWILGNDDLLLPNTFFYLERLFTDNTIVDFFYINSFHLDSSLVLSGQQPFDTNNLPKKMKKFSNFPKNFQSNFFDLVNHNISFDFMLGMFLIIFKKKIWDKNLFRIDQSYIEDKKTYSTFENTAPHIIIWSSGFKNSKAYFQSKPLSVNTHGVREWVDLYPFVESIRIPEVLDYYRLAGLPLHKYLYYKNFALRKLFISLFQMYFFKNVNGLKFIDINKHIVSNLLYPSIYFGAIYFIFRKVFKIIFRIKTKSS